MKNGDISQKIKDKAKLLCSKVETFSVVIFLWLKFLKNWMELEPVFNSEDIKQQLKTESTQFEIKNKWWMDHMKNANDNKKLFKHVEQAAD